MGFVKLLKSNSRELLAREDEKLVVAFRRERRLLFSI